MDEDEIVEAVLTTGRQRLVQMLTNLLSMRIDEDNYHWSLRIGRRLQWLRTYRPYHSPSHPNHRMYEEWSAEHHYPKQPNHTAN
jgi:hypothetical protein